MPTFLAITESADIWLQAAAEDVLPPVPGVWNHLFASLRWLLYATFVIWMAVYCARRDSESRLWLWIILIIHPFGPLIYFFVRFLPSASFTLPKPLWRFTRGADLRKKEAAASQIGNAHQYVELGDLQRELGKWDQAAESYARALDKDGDSLPALWGAASVHYRQRDFSACRRLTECILARDFSYKFGDVSLLHGKALCELDDDVAARLHLQEHVRRWRHPEAIFLLANLLAQQGETAAAKGHLLAMIQDIDTSPRSIARKFFFWKGRAKRLLRSLS